MDVAMASKNIMLQAYDEKIGSCPECFLPFGMLW